MDLIAISNLPWDSYFPPGVGPRLGSEARTYLATPQEIAPWLAPGSRERLEGEGPGGSPTNAALAFAGLGGSATVVGPVAGDEYGMRVRAGLARRGVRLVEVTPAPGAQAHSLGFRETGGERRFLATKPALPGLARTGLAAAVGWPGPGWLVSSAYELADPGMRRLVLDAFAAAKRGGRRLAFDLADPNFVRRQLVAVEEILSLGLDVLITGEEALNVLPFTKDNAPKENAARDRGARDQSAGPGAPLARATVLTLGAGGMRVTLGGRELDYAASPAAVRDTTGAGDALLGAYLFALSRELKEDQAAGLALAAAGQCVGVLGSAVSESSWCGLRTTFGVGAGR